MTISTLRIRNMMHGIASLQICRMSRGKTTTKPLLEDLSLKPLERCSRQQSTSLSNPGSFLPVWRTRTQEKFEKSLSIQSTTRRILSFFFLPFLTFLFSFFFFQEIPPIVVFPHEQGVWSSTFRSSYLPRQLDDQAMFTSLLSTFHAGIGN